MQLGKDSHGGVGIITVNRHCFWRGGVRVPSIITHKISSPQVWISSCPTSRGGGVGCNTVRGCIVTPPY